MGYEDIKVFDLVKIVGHGLSQRHVSDGVAGTARSLVCRPEYAIENINGRPEGVYRCQTTEPYCRFEEKGICTCVQVRERAHRGFIPTLGGSVADRIGQSL